MQKTSKINQIAIDNTGNLCYNDIMKNNNTTTKENEMNSQWKSTIGNLRTYQGSIVAVISENEFWNEAKIRFVSPEGKQTTGIFVVGLPRLKKLGKN